ncbi:ECF transporter S component [Litchfieldia salsa]|uniref:Energy-coupling factor transport system substrate-specific component n=1 Tax=Litchfieldia salsa TaxID=930152 RepID=A0A1H0UYC2_9BACI|nr:ECF transporter S component [Litchfieldia salsa]SDP71154.1 energy-coupling factor transport system substrate-specific component [Litchfieldia salsa]
MTKGLKLTDILVTIVIAIAFGIVYILWGSLYYAVKPLGLHLDQFLYGMWFIAAPVAYLIIRKPGVALIAEIAAASGEFLLGSPWGLSVLLYGVVQGLFFELVIMSVKYKKYNLAVIILGGLAATLGSVIMDFAYGEIGDLAAWNLILYLVMRFIGGIVFAGIVPYYLVKVLEATGVTNLVRPASKEDYDALDK